jgi:hypothetical protein
MILKISKNRKSFLKIKRETEGEFFGAALGLFCFFIHKRIERIKMQVAVRV